MRQIAFYGKGGAGKSTVVSNLTATLAANGKKILHIGCDPKHDSTRSLLAGRTPATAVELLTKKTPASITLDDLVIPASHNIDCIEVGGPEPGAGCAGLGIIKTLELIQNLNLLQRPYDFVLFDVLGDVVCGGFATPMRLKFAEEVFVVLSGEMMSLYAANNICRGIARYAKNGKVRLAGFIGNQRAGHTNSSILQPFAHRLGSQLVQLIPRDDLITAAERACTTVVNHSPDSTIAQTFKTLAQTIQNGTPLTAPTPMTDPEFEQFFVKESSE